MTNLLFLLTLALSTTLLFTLKQLHKQKRATQIAQQRANELIQQSQVTQSHIAQQQDQALNQLLRQNQELSDQLAANQKALQAAIRQVQTLDQQIKELQDQLTTSQQNQKVSEDLLYEAETNQKAQIQILTAKLQAAQAQVVTVTQPKAAPANVIILNTTEPDFYPDEKRDLLLAALKHHQNAFFGTRRQHIIDDILLNNQPGAASQALKAEIDKTFRGYRSLTKKITSQLHQIGFVLISDHEHYKMRFHGDHRYQITFSKTPSPCNVGKKIASDIRRTIL